MPESHHSEQLPNPEAASPKDVVDCCRTILQEAGVDLSDKDVIEALDMIAVAEDPEIALTTAISAFEGLDLPYEGLFVLLAEKGIIEDFR